MASVGQWTTMDYNGLRAEMTVSFPIEEVKSQGASFSFPFSGWYQRLYVPNGELQDGKWRKNKSWVLE